MLQARCLTVWTVDFGAADPGIAYFGIKHRANELWNPHSFDLVRKSSCR